MKIRSAIGLLVCSLFVSASAEAKPTVELREVESHIQDQRLDLAGLLRSALRREIQQVDLSHAKTSAVLSATVIRFERSGDATECTISAAVRTKQGRLVALLSGKATATSGSSEALALDGAVHGALAHLPDALK